MMDADEGEVSPLRRLRREILAARSRVYAAGAPTPLQRVKGPDGVDLLVKREDLSPIKAYKWRGAYNRMAVLTDEERERGVVAASAGNHAQGVALAAASLRVKARIHMPRSTPGIKQEAVLGHGGSWVEVVLTGDAYDDALRRALEDCRENGGVYIHAYDDLLVMAGQGTLADEVATSGESGIDAAFLQIGGGGLAAGVGAWLKMLYPRIRIIAVEGEDQACYAAARQAGRPVRLDHVDLFCDGTAVRQVGDWPFAILPGVVDEEMTVSNEEVCEAIRFCWNQLRCVPEPSGAMGLAGLLRRSGEFSGRKVLAVLCGANVDFGQLGVIASQAGVGSAKRFFWRITIPEKPGSMLALLEKGLGTAFIYDFLYGKTDSDRAWPVFGFSCSEEEKEAMAERLRTHGYKFEEVTDDEDVHFGIIPYEARLFAHPVFLNLEFHERSGALFDFLNQTIRGKANFCFFQYRYSGERVGRALIGLEFNSADHRDRFLAEMPTHGQGFRHCAPVSKSVAQRLTGS